MGKTPDEDNMLPMTFAIDFDGSLVLPVDEDDPLSLVQLQPGVYDALMALKRAGHTLLLYSARANTAARSEPYRDPLVRSGARLFDLDKWTADQPVAEARYQQMLDFVKKNLDGVFDAIDDGVQGKPNVDIFFDDKGRMVKIKNIEKAWGKISRKYGR